jgi:hypothetical protein
MIFDINYEKKLMKYIFLTIFKKSFEINILKNIDDLFHRFNTNFK